MPFWLPGVGGTTAAARRPRCCERHGRPSGENQRGRLSNATATVRAYLRPWSSKHHAEQTAGLTRRALPGIMHLGCATSRRDQKLTNASLASPSCCGEAGGLWGALL